MDTYKEAFKGLNAAQKQAVTTIEGPVLVIAGPGTGKTQLLTTRIAYILETTDTLPQNILCLTFTDSAAQTMRERLAGMIGQAAYDVTISTYHAFGSDLIRRFPDYFAQDADLEPIDDLGLDRILRSIVAGLPYGNPLKYSDNYLSDIKTLISDAKRALLSPSDLRTVAKQNLAFIQKTSPPVARTLDEIARIDKKAIPLFSALLEMLQQPISEKDTAVQPLVELFMADLQEAAPIARQARQPRLPLGKINGWPKIQKAISLSTVPRRIKNSWLQPMSTSSILLP
jgi:superfamily I DNA/RNA helicase